MNSVGERIQDIRGKVSREKFAPMTGISRNTLVNYEKGDSSPPTDYLTRVLALFPDINPTWLLTGKGPMKGFVAEEPTQAQREAVAQESKGTIAVDEDLLEAASNMLEEKLGDRKAELSAGKLMTLTMTLFRIYSSNFIESAEFRKDTLETNVKSLIKLALPDG